MYALRLVAISLARSSLDNTSAYSRRRTERAAQRVRPARPGQPRAERALARRADPILLRRAGRLAQPQRPGFGQGGELAVDLATGHGEEPAEALTRGSHQFATGHGAVVEQAEDGGGGGVHGNGTRGHPLTVPSTRRVCRIDGSSADRGSAMRARCASASPHARPTASRACRTDAPRVPTCTRCHRGTGSSLRRAVTATSLAWPWRRPRRAGCRRPRRRRRAPRRATACSAIVMATCRSASVCLIAWNEPTGTPNCLRSRS